MNRKHLIVSGSVVAFFLVGLLAAWLAKVVDFFAPWWLLGLLAIPFFFFMAIKGIAGLPPRTNAFSSALRSILFSFIVLCLADIQFVKTNKDLTVLYLMDHSASVPEDIVNRELTYVNESAGTKKKDDQAGILVFGENASMELMPVKDLQVDRIYSAINKDQTDLQQAIELATAAFPSGTRKKIVLITDGNQTQGDLVEGIKFASGNNVMVDILPVGYDYQNEVMVDKVYLPDKIKENETFDLRVHVSSLQEGPAELSIFRNGISVVKQKIDLEEGRNTYTVSMKIDEPGFYAFNARVNASTDTIQQNNEASGHVYIQGSSRILLVAPTRTEIDYLAEACRGDHLETDFITPDQFPDSLGQLQNHDCIVLANVSADELTESQMAMIQANVRDLGVGLVMIGGQDSFGAGGYESTPVEEALPVTMDIQQKKINPKGALALVLHTCEFANGNYWAKEISKRAIETVNAQDDVGVLHYGLRDEWLFKLQPASNKSFMFSRIDGANPGDMPSFEPTIEMAYNALKENDAMVKHIIVISDGDPASPRTKLIQEIAAAGITISTVAINPHSPRDVDVMKYLAYKTGGRYYFANDPSVLPKIFIKEAKVVKRSLIFNQEFRPLLVQATELTKGVQAGEVPSLLAYVATTPKPRALVPMVSDNDNQDPVLAYWRYGLGKSVAFTSDATSNWAKNWVAWDKYEKFWTQAIRWVSRKREKSNLTMRTQMEGSKGKLIVDAVDPEGGYINFLKLTGRIVDPENKGSTLDIRQTAPGRYEAEFEAGSAGVSIINVGYQNPQTGGQGFNATGVSIPYSPEFKHLESNLPLLRRAVNASGGAILSGNPEKDRIFESNLAPSVSFQPIWEFLMWAVVLLFFLDVVVRRVIITREDFASGFLAFKESFAGRKRARDGQDETMAALLRRKEKTFEKVEGEKAPAKARSFKSQLAETAKTAKPVFGDASAVGEARQGVKAPEKAAAPSATPVSKSTSKETAASEASSYTSRLLDAKRRAQGTKGSDASDD